MKKADAPAPGVAEKSPAGFPFHDARGSPLETATRRQMESHFGHDFGSVRIHDDEEAAESAKSVNALAYTVGSDIVFGAGQYAPHTKPGRRLLAHELTHTIQQRWRTGNPACPDRQDCLSSTMQRQDASMSAPTDPLEMEADRAADAAAGGFLVEDDALPSSGQMRKSELLDELQRASCEAADAELARVGRSTEGCPYIERAFTRYRGMAAPRVEQTLRRWVGDATVVTGAHDYVPLVARRVTEGVSRWATTGDLSGVPPEIAEAAMGGGSMLGMLGGFLGNLFFKREGGGAATPAEAAMVSTSLGRGAPLESGVRGRMESAFGYDFSRVRIHSGETAAGVSSTLGARAFTFGGDIGFAAGEYQPNTLFGDALIAHELAHVVQQSGGGGGTTSEVEEDADHSAVGAVVSLWGGAKRVARSAMPRLRAGLRLQRCSDQKKPPVTPAAVQPPQVVPEQAKLVDKVPAPVAACHGRPDERACQHEKYVTTVLPQAIKNIRAVKTPYSEAIASTYESALPAAQKAPPPPEGMGTSPAEGGPVTVTFAGTTHTFTKFVISLQNFWGGANGQAFGAGGTIAYIMLNEGSENALRGELPPIEETMVHEMIHIFDQIVTAQNAGRAAGTPARNVNLDVTTYAGVQTKLEAALLPFVQQIHQLPGFASNKPKDTPELNASSTATAFISETIARTEAGIYVKQRGGGTFTAADFPTFLAHMHNANYWSPRPPDLKELSDWIKAHEAEINEKIAPLVDEAAALYLKERPAK